MTLYHKPKWSNLLWDASWITDAHKTQTLKLEDNQKLPKKKHILKQDISPTCDLCTSHQYDTCLQLLS